MKKMNILRCAVLTAWAIFTTMSVKANNGIFPWAKLSFSGTMTFGNQRETNVNGNFSSGTGEFTVSFNNQKLMALLNASPTFIAALTNQFTNIFQIPAGSFFVWNITNTSDQYLIITNKNGFSFNLDRNVTNNFGGLDYDNDYLFGNFTLKDATHDGTETDQTGIYFWFDDYNGNQINAYGAAKLTWTYAPASSGNQKATLTVSINTDGGGYDGEVAGWNAVVNMKGSGSGTGTDPEAQSPFYLFWY